MSSELTGLLPGLSPFLADTMINRAWRDVRDAKLWSWLQEDAGVFCPVQTTAGTVSVTQFSDTATCDATASAALLAISLPAPLDLTALQIRFGGAGPASQVGQVYNITAFDDTDPTAVVLTFGRVYMAVTNATASYQCYRCYITPTVQDFLMWQSFVDMINGWALRLNFSSTYFDQRDPQRTAQGMAYYVGSYKGNPESEPQPRYELWPHPTSGQQFYTRYRRVGEDFTSPADVPPVLIPEDLIMARAFGYHAYPFAAANVSRFPAMKGANWIALIMDAKKNYKELLLQTKKQDENQELQSVWARGHGLIHRGRFPIGFKGMSDWPIDAAFMQSHLLSF